MIRLWDLETFQELCSTATSSAIGCNHTELDSNFGTIPTDIAVDSSGQKVAVIFDESNELRVYEIVQQDGTDLDPFSLELMCTMACPSQPLAVLFYDDGENFGDDTMMVLMGEPEYFMAYTLRRDKLILQSTEVSVVANIHALRELVEKEDITMPTSLLEKNPFGKPKLQKENETRGPGSADAPWNRVERVEIAKERMKKRQRRVKGSSMD